MKKKLNRHEIMSRIRSKDTKIEIAIRKELWRRGIRYRVNCKTVFGKPDICFKGKKIAVFCDSEFWHGKDFLEGKTPHSHQEYWISKFKHNIERDKRVNKELKKEGWTVIRLWGKDIQKNTKKCVDKIENAIKNKE